MSIFFKFYIPNKRRKKKQNWKQIKILLTLVLPATPDDSLLLKLRREHLQIKTKNSQKKLNL